MDGGPNRRSKAAFSNPSGVIWTGSQRKQRVWEGSGSCTVFS